MTKMVSLRSSDGQELKVAKEAIIAASGMIKGILEKDSAGGDADAIPVPDVTARILSRVLEYVNKHFSDPLAAADYYVPIPGDPLEAFDDAFIQVDQDTLFDLVAAANCLDMPGLMDLTCRAVASQIRGRSIEGIREHFQIVNDYTPEEEEDVRRDNAWAFE